MPEEQDVAEAPAPAEAPAEPTWTTYSDTTTFEMMPIVSATSLAGIGISPTARAYKAAYEDHPNAGVGDYLTRFPGDAHRANWWVTPAAVVQQRYAQWSEPPTDPPSGGGRPPPEDE